MMSMTLVGALASALGSRQFFFIASLAVCTGTVGQHVGTDFAHACTVPDLPETGGVAIAHWRHSVMLGHAAGLGLPVRIEMQVYPRVDAEHFALLDKILFAIGQFYRMVQI